MMSFHDWRLPPAGFPDILDIWSRILWNLCPFWESSVPRGIYLDLWFSENLYYILHGNLESGIPSPGDFLVFPSESCFLIHVFSVLVLSPDSQSCLPDIESCLLFRFHTPLWWFTEHPGMLLLNIMCCDVCMYGLMCSLSAILLHQWIYSSRFTNNLYWTFFQCSHL